MKINLYEIIKKQIPEYIVERGIPYFLSDDVEIMKYDFYSTYSYDDSIKITASVKGTKTYTVLLNIILDKNKNIKSEYTCSCPAFKDRGYCKHIPAVVLKFIFQGVLEEDDGSLQYWKKEDLEDLDDLMYYISYTDKLRLKNSFLWYVQKRYLPEKIKSFFDNEYGYTKANIEDFFKLPSLAFKSTTKNENKEDKLYKVKIKYDPYNVYLGLFKAKILKNGKLSPGKELSKNQNFPKKYDTLKPFMLSNSYYDDYRYTLENSYEFFILMCKKFIDKLYFDKYKINSVKDGFKLKLSIEKLAKDIDKLFLRLIISNGEKKYLISDFQNIFYKNNVGFAHKDSEIIFFTGSITDELFKYILNDYNLVKLGNKEILNKLKTNYLENIEGLENIGYKTEKINPKFKLIIKPDFENEEILFKNEISYNNKKIDILDKNEILQIEKNTIFKKNLQKENEFKTKLENIFQKSFSDEIQIDIDEKIGDIFDKIDNLKEDEIEVFYEENVKKITSNVSLSFNIKSGIDFFDLNTKLKIDNQEIDKLGQFLKSLKKSNGKLIKLENNIVVVLNERIKKQLEYLEEIGIDEKNADENIKLSKYNIGTLLINKENLAYDKGFKELKEKLENFEGIKTTKLPKNLNAQLRNYQKVGYNWLNFLNEYNFGGILADDMGLGKTLQTLSVLQKVYNDKKNKKQSLIVCPTSLVFNWIEEAKKFTPNLKIDYIKDSNTGFSNISKDTQIVVVSYGLLTNLVEKGDLQDKEFLYVVLDEAQNIKNYNTKRAKAIYSLKANYRLALTGTPIENNLLELWSIFHFLMPGFLGTVNKFKQKYINNKGNLQYLSHKIKPFILRRTKAEVLKDLPEKQEKTILLELNSKQKAFYEKLAKAVKADIQKEIETQGFKKSQFKILEYLTKLRLACLNPNLVADNAPNDSAKLDYLSEKLEELLASNHSILIFSQFTKFLTQVKDILDKNNIDYFYLDGATNKKKRAEYVEKFQNKEKQIFLISLKAGGTGLNLTQADYVIHLDPWWNPAVENQATDRAHRIGQKRSVIVQKLIGKGTIEEKILLLQEKKKKLIDDLFSGDFGAKLTKEDIEFVLE